MSDIKTYKKIENLGWESFRRTGNINDYGIIVSAREKIKEKQAQINEQENGYGM